MKQIPLTRGKVALVDDEDFIFLSQWKWHAHYSRGLWYARRFEGDKSLMMHRVLLAATGKVFGDHRDGDGLNNQKFNLRPATRSQNMANRKLHSNNPSGFKGVRRHKRGWQARLRHNSKEVHLGYFVDRITAARAYDKAAVELFGEFAKTNEMLGLL